MYQHIKEFQAYLKEKKAVAAFIRYPENIVMFSQYWPRYGFSFILIPAEGKPAIICPYVELEDTKRVGIDNAIGIGDVKFEDGDANENLISAMKELIAKYQIPEGSRIAIEIGEDMIAPTFTGNKIQLCGRTYMHALSETFKTTDYVPVLEGVLKARSIKTQADLEMLQLVNEIQEKALDYFEELLEKPGITENEVLIETQGYFSKLACGYKGIRGVNRIFGQLSSGAEKTSVAWAEGIISENRKLEKGDLCLIEFSGCIEGYWCDLTRTGCVGGFEGKKKEVRDMLTEAFMLGVAAAKDGVTAGEVDRVVRGHVEQAGYGEYFVHNAGHGTGFIHHEGYPVIAPASKDVLHTNTVVAIEPGVYIPGFGAIRVEHDVVVGPNGGRVLGK